MGSRDGQKRGLSLSAACGAVRGREERRLAGCAAATRPSCARIGESKETDAHARCAPHRVFLLSFLSYASELAAAAASGRAFERETETRFRRVRVRRHAGPTTGAHAPCILKEKMCSAHGVFFSRRKRSTTFVRCPRLALASRPRKVSYSATADSVSSHRNLWIPPGYLYGAGGRGAPARVRVGRRPLSSAHSGRRTPHGHTRPHSARFGFSRVASRVTLPPAHRATTTHWNTLSRKPRLIAPPMRAQRLQPCLPRRAPWRAEQQC